LPVLTAGHELEVNMKTGGLWEQKASEWRVNTDEKSWEESVQEYWQKWWTELKGITPFCWHQHKWWKRQWKLRRKGRSCFFIGLCKECTGTGDRPHSV